MSLSLLTRRVATPVCARAFTTSAPRMDFGWNKLVTPLTNPAFIARMKELDTKFAAMKTEMFGVAPKVEAVDWAFWETNIENKALVAQLKKEYENQKFAEIEGEDLTQTNADLDFAISKANGAAAISREEIPALKLQLAKQIKQKAEIHDWSMEDHYKAMPGLEEQLREEYMNGEFLPSEYEKRCAAIDISEIRKQFKSGAELQLPEGMPDRYGDWSFKAEKKKNDIMLQKMFGGSKQFEALQVAQRAADAKKEAAEKAYAEHH